MLDACASLSYAVGQVLSQRPCGLKHPKKAQVKKIQLGRDCLPNMLYMTG